MCRRVNIIYCHFYLKYVYLYTHIFVHTLISMLVLGKKMLSALLKIVNNSNVWREELWV